MLLLLDFRFYDFRFLPKAVWQLCDEDSGVYPLEIRYEETFPFQIQEVLCESYNPKTFIFEKVWKPVKYTKEDLENLKAYYE